MPLRKLLWLDLIHRAMYLATAVLVIVVALFVAGDMLGSVPRPTLLHHIIAIAIVAVSIFWSTKLQLLAWKPLDLVAVHKQLRGGEKINEQT